MNFAQNSYKIESYTEFFCRISRLTRKFRLNFSSTRRSFRFGGASTAGNTTILLENFVLVVIQPLLLRLATRFMKYPRFHVSGLGAADTGRVLARLLIRKSQRLDSFMHVDKIRFQGSGNATLALVTSLEERLGNTGKGHRAESGTWYKF